MKVALPPPPKKGRKRSPLERRADATRLTVSKFLGKRFTMRGGRDCGQLVRVHVRHLGIKWKVSLAALGSYKDCASAAKALQRVGFPSIPALLDVQFERIPFASALVGDLLQLDAGDGEFAELGAMAVYLGNNAALGFHEDSIRAESLLLLETPLACWRVIA